MSVEEYMNRGCCEETMGKPSGLSQVPSQCDCSPSRLEHILRWLARDNGNVLGCRIATMVERVQMVMDRMSLSDQTLLQEWLKENATLHLPTEAQRKEVR